MPVFVRRDDQGPWLTVSQAYVRLGIAIQHGQLEDVMTWAEEVLRAAQRERAASIDGDDD